MSCLATDGAEERGLQAGKIGTTAIRMEHWIDSRARYTILISTVRQKGLQNPYGVNSIYGTFLFLFFVFPVRCPYERLDKSIYPNTDQ